jgi:hypothetical protein
MTRECHVRICERLGVKFPRADSAKRELEGKCSCWRKPDVRPRRREWESLRIASALSRRSYHGRICRIPEIGTLMAGLYDITHAPFAVVVAQPLAI